MTASGLGQKYTDYIGDFKLNIQPAGPESTVLINGVYGRTFRAFMTYSGLNINDKVVVGADEYRVKGIEPYNYGSLEHYEALLTLPEI